MQVDNALESSIGGEELLQNYASMGAAAGVTSGLVGMMGMENEDAMPVRSRRNRGTVPPLQLDEAFALWVEATKILRHERLVCALSVMACIHKSLRTCMYTYVYTMLQLDRCDWIGLENA